jgi:coenzyme F420 hydrogenase subunit beta
MILKNGFYLPKFNSALTGDESEKIYKCCPGIHIESKEKIKDVWGNVLAINEAWSANDEIRKKASSGGIISSLAIHLLETKRADAVLQVGTSDTSYLYNQLNISRTREDILKNIGSRYAPALVFDKLTDILDSNNENFAFIGKPCDIAAIRNFTSVFPQYANKIKYFLSMFCAGIPSYEGTKKVLELSGCNEEPYSIKYRGDGCPGFFEAKYRNGQNFRMSYSDSWGKILGKHLGFRCKICPDGIGLLADIAVGDLWNTKDGYPDFEESDGRSFVILRTKKGLELFNDAIENNAVHSRELDINRIAEIQKYQYQRRLLSAYRILPIQILAGIVKFKKLGIYHLFWRADKKQGIKNMLGTLKRFAKITLK